jgi:dihydroxyacetone kinase-like predicted kinase
VTAREAITTAGVCRPGDVLGVVQGDFAVIGADLASVAEQVTDRLLSGGGELVTLVRGQGADEALVSQLAQYVRRTRRGVELNLLDGGQDRYPLLIGVE